MSDIDGLEQRVEKQGYATFDDFEAAIELARQYEQALKFAIHALRAIQKGDTETYLKRNGVNMARFEGFTGDTLLVRTIIDEVTEIGLRKARGVFSDPNLPMFWATVPE